MPSGRVSTVADSFVQPIDCFFEFFNLKFDMRALDEAIADLICVNNTLQLFII